MWNVAFGGAMAVLAGRAADFTSSRTGSAKPIGQRSLPYGRTLTSVSLFEGYRRPEVPEEIEAPCHALFALNGTSLLGIDLYQSEEGRWTFHSATPLPDMCVGGTPLLQEIVKTWSSQAIQ